MLCTDVDTDFAPSQESLPGLSDSSSRRTVHGPVPDLKLIHRFRVKAIATRDDKVVLQLAADRSPFEFKCTLSGTWTGSRVSAGDVANVFSSRFTEADGFLVSDTDGFVVINPDKLISCTAVASTLYCQRKSWLSEKFKGWGAGNKVMLIGTLVHELLQTCCLEQLHQQQQIEKRMKEMLTGKEFLLSAYLNAMTEQELEESVSAYIPWIVQWLATYVVGEAGELHGDARKKLKILKFHDIEDNIWCHYHGVKGKVDFTVEVRIYDNRDFTSKKEVLPMELKTGKSSFSPEHVAQAILYSMMMHDRQFGACESALLLYLKDGPKLKHVIPSDPTRIALIQRRNDQEYFTRQQVIGPDLKDSKHSCSSCDHLLDCSLMARNFEPDKLAAASHMPLLVDAATGHLSALEVSFFGDWVAKLYTHQNPPTISDDFWNESADDREEQGLSLAGMRISGQKKFTYTFSRADGYKSRREVSSVIQDWNVRDRVAISLDQQPETGRDMVAILTGFIQKIENGSITCTFDKSLQECLKAKLFRVDRLARSATAFLSNFNSLLRLMSPNSPNACELRKSIISKHRATSNVRMVRSEAVVVKRILTGVDDKVKAAVVRSLICDRYSLFETSPESEVDFKQFLCLFSQVMVATSTSLLLTSSSIATLDEMLTVLKSNGVPFMRLLKSNTNDALKDNSEDTRLADCTTVAQIRHIYDSEMVIASSISGIVNHAYFELREKDFDFCVQLDADQPLLTQAVAPLFRCKRFLLIRNTGRPAGDDNLFSHLMSDGEIYRF